MEAHGAEWRVSRASPNHAELTITVYSFTVAARQVALVFCCAGCVPGLGTKSVGKARLRAKRGRQLRTSPALANALQAQRRLLR